MTARPSIDPAEFLHEHLAQASPDLMRELMEGFVNTLLSAEADSVCGAAFGVRDEARVNRRNGYRHRDLDTRVGTLDVAVAEAAGGLVFPGVAAAAAAAGGGGADERGGDGRGISLVIPPDRVRHTHGLTYRSQARTERPGEPSSVP